MLRKVSKTLASSISFLRFAFEAKQQNDVKCKAFRSQHLIRHLIYFWKEKCRNLQFICSPGDFCLFSRTKRQNSISKGMALKSEREVSGQISVICPQKKSISQPKTNMKIGHSLVYVALNGISHCKAWIRALRTISMFVFLSSQFPSFVCLYVRCANWNSKSSGGIAEMIAKRQTHLHFRYLCGDCSLVLFIGFFPLLPLLFFFW